MDTMKEATEYFDKIKASWRSNVVITGNGRYVNEGRSHTINIYRGRKEVDCISFGDFAKNKTQIDEFWIAVATHDKEINEDQLLNG